MNDVLAARHYGTQGPRVALVHGWGWDGRLLAPLAQALGAHCRVVQPDLPGYGLNVGQRCDGFDHGVDQLARAVPDAEVLVGWSLGGLLAVAWAARAPVRRLALVGASPRFMQAADWPHGMTEERFDAFAEGLEHDPRRTRTRFAALAALGDSDARGVRGAMAALMDDLPPAAPALSQGLDWLREQDLRDTLRSLPIPLCCLHGEQDHVVDMGAAAKEAAERWIPVPGAAHLPWRHHELSDLCAWVCADD
ncbi:alpha/beta fold hydrolase [Methyloversatilis discipulorum]|uniref:alpha/beta fold hydrolase n=1 Tax=Methyloversatilis discipulorum TaxID=1119528 RepID=UPI00035F5FBF|nr:alpha/beta fold hydrolase [Methyloversatilis discipulorum]